MPDFSHLLRKPAGMALPPPVLMAAWYPGIIRAWSVGENQNKNAYVRFQLGLSGWPDNVPEERRFAKDKDGKPTDQHIDLSKKQFRRDFYLTDDALIYLDDLIRSCGIEPNGEPYEVILPNLIGANVLVEVTEQVSERTGSMVNYVNGVKGQQ